MLFNDQDLIKIMVTEPGGLEHEEMRLNPALLRNINICLLVFSPDIKESFQQLDYWKEALQLFSPSAVIKYVYNKYDLAE